MVCTECGKTYNDKMAVCPFCGAHKEETIELEILDLDDILEFEEVDDEKPDNQDEEIELELEVEETLELDIVETEENSKAELQSFSDLDDLESYERVEIKVERKEYKENQIILDSDDIKYYLKSDKRRIKVIISLFVALVGSFFNFWGIATEAIGNIKMGSLFAGYGLGGILGKICVLIIIGAIVLTVINLTKYAMFAVGIGFFTMFAQVVVCFISSIEEDFQYAVVMKYFYPDLGFFIMALCLAIAIIYLAKSPEKQAQKLKEAAENEISPEELLKEAIAEQQEDIQKQKEKMQAKEDKKAAKEIAKAEKKNKKSKKSKVDKEEQEEELVLEVEEELQFEEVDDDIKSKKKSKKQKKG